MDHNDSQLSFKSDVYVDPGKELISPIIGVENMLPFCDHKPRCMVSEADGIGPVRPGFTSPDLFHHPEGLLFPLVIVGLSKGFFPHHSGLLFSGHVPLSISAIFSMISFAI